MRRLVLALAPTLAGCVPSTTCDAPGLLCLSSEAAVRTQTNIGANAMASLDLDGDGHLDLVTTGEGTLSALWGGPAGLTGTATTWSIDQEVTGLAVADLDGDGRLDLATALPRADAVAVLPGRGDRSFGSPTRHAAGKGPRALIAADLDAGGPPELVTANLDDGTITVLRNLVAAPPEVVGPGPRALAAGDLDGDGDIDLAIALADADAVQVMHGDGHGGLRVGTRHPVGAAPRSLAVADLDDDGALDIATADALGDTISILYADGTGGHRVRKATPTLAQPTGLIAMKDAADRSILAVLSETSMTIARIDPRLDEPFLGALFDQPSALASGAADVLHYASPLGQFGALSMGPGLRLDLLWDNPDLTRAWAVDIDGDGIDELVEIDADAKPGTLTLRRADGQHLSDIDTGLFQDSEGVLAADVTGDGRRDLVVWTDAVAVLVQQPDGVSFVAGPSHPTDIAPQVGEIDGDGQIDLLTADVDPTTATPTTSTLRWWNIDPTGALSETRSIPLDFVLKAAAAVRADDDDRADLVLAAQDSQFHFLVGAAGASSPAPGFAPDWELDRIALADLDDDGELDAVGCTLGDLIFTSDVLSYRASTSTVLDKWCRSVRLADLDGDGVRDLLVESSVLFTTQRTRLTGQRREGDTWKPLGGFPLDLPAASIAPARLNDDETPELLVQDSSGGMRAYRLSLGPALVEFEDVSFRSSGGTCFGDLDGDGATDLVFAGSDLGVAVADGRGGFGPVLRYDARRLVDASEPRVACVVADFDADGTDELVIGISSRELPAVALARVALDPGGGLTLTTRGAAGPDLAALAAADLDRDGALDLVAFGGSEPFTINFFRGDGSGNFSETPATSTPSTRQKVRGPQLFDVDHDGRLDLVSHASNAEFFVFPGKGDGLFEPGRLYSPLRAERYDLGDVDADGHLDLVGVVSNRVVSTTPGLDRPPITLLSGSAAVALDDLDGDGRLELFAAAPRPFKPAGAGVLHVGRARDSSGLAFTAHDVPIQGAPTLKTADFDGDGLRDVALLDVNGVTIVRQSP